MERLTQAKDVNGVQLVCTVCRRNMTVNECVSDKGSPDNCYYCHLQKEHIVNETEKLK